MFTFDQLFVPVWDTDTIYGESFTMHRDKNGEICAPFLYHPTKILEVRSATLETEYEEGIDWYVKDGRLYLTETTRIPFMEYEDIYMKEELPGRCFPYPEGYLLFSEGHFYHSRQIAVSYKCENGGWKGYVPVYEGERLHRTIKKLKEDKKLKMVLYGDSISAGSNASAKTMANPFQPIWGDLLAERLRRHYGAQVDFVNTSMGGQDSIWAIKNLEERVLSENPDLVILGFGMNGCHKPEVFKEHLTALTERIKAANNETDIIIIATSTPNPILTDPRAKFYNYQHLYGDVCYGFEGDGIAIANVQAVQKELHRHKRFIDTTGNNVNHPNDFFIRIHAQIFAAMLIEK